ncbi:hypothetical protein EJB05_29110, partial [Eragrostis curvula]
MFSPSSGDIEVSYSTAGDANTLAAARTSAGHRIAISLDLAPPPAESHARVCFPDGGVTETVIAAHGDSVLVEVSLKRPTTTPTTPPPSLRGRRPCPCSRRAIMAPRSRSRRGECWTARALASETPATAELVLLRSGEWRTVRPAFSGAELTRWGGTHGVVPVGAGLLCFFNLHGGLMICNVFAERPALRYVPLPAGGTAMSPPNGGTGTSDAHVLHALLAFASRTTQKQVKGPKCSFVEHQNYKVLYRRYASLFFLVGVDNDEV